MPKSDQDADAHGGQAKKTAVVVVHGMGEQRPMETLWGLVRALWDCDPSVKPKHAFTYSKPDSITGSFELRRITTDKSVIGKRIDFFELYWAHLMQGNSIASVWAAVKMLLIRKPSTVPPRLTAVWIVGLIVVAAVFIILALSALSALPSETRGRLMQPPLMHALFGWVTGWMWLVPVGLAAILRYFAGEWLGPVAGDAARYLNAAPDNVAARQAIREAAVDLLEKLHASDAYDRIVVVGHSLGTSVAYDTLTFAWSRIPGTDFLNAHKAHPEAMKAFERLEQAGAKLHAPPPGSSSGVLRTAYRKAQRAYFEHLRTLTRVKDGVTIPLWLVSDFVSTASPLSKADVLMARDPAGFHQRVDHRELPTAPPKLEKLKPPRFSYRARDPVRAPHHAATFGPTVWTNIYFNTDNVVLGDVIAGPVRSLFGEGVLDVRVSRAGSVFRHLDYWKDPTFVDAQKRPRPWIAALRRAVNLNEEMDPVLWGSQVDAAEIVADILPAQVKPPAPPTPSPA